MRGMHLIRHWAATQTTVALFSGEAELGGIAKGLSQGLGLRSIASDLGITLALRLRTDATAAIGMSRRLGVGKVRHLDTSLLWVQERVRSGEVSIEKIPGPQNPGDALTKYWLGPELRGHFSRMNVEICEGRPPSAPKLTSSLSADLSHVQKIVSIERDLDMQRRRHYQDEHRYHEKAEQQDACQELFDQETQSCSSISSLPSQRSHVPCHECGVLQPKQADVCGVCEVGLWMAARPRSSGLPRGTCGKVSTLAPVGGHDGWGQVRGKPNTFPRSPGPVAADAHPGLPRGSRGKYSPPGPLRPSGVDLGKVPTHGRQGLLYSENVSGPDDHTIYLANALDDSEVLFDFASSNFFHAKISYDHRTHFDLEDLASSPFCHGALSNSFCSCCLRTPGKTGFQRLDPRALDLKTAILSWDEANNIFSDLFAPDGHYEFVNAYDYFNESLAGFGTKKRRNEKDERCHCKYV